MDLSNRYSSVLLGFLRENKGVQQVLRSELYLFSYYIIIGYPYLDSVHTPFAPQIHPLGEHLVPLDCGRNFFNLGYTWQHVALEKS